MSYGDATLDMQGAGAFVSVFSAFAGAQAQQTALRYQAAIADINAAASERAAQAALLAGQRQEMASTLAAGNLMSAQRTAFAANGVDLGVGSAARVQASTKVMSQIDAAQIAANAVRSAWGYRTQATNFRNDAATGRAAAAAVSPAMKAGTSLLTSATSIASSWYALNKAGELDRYAANRPAAKQMEWYD